jgi:chromosome segregation ATPase
MDQPANHLLLRGSQPGTADRMRELLARTVQDHVFGQLSHASALEEIRKHLEGLEWLVKEVRERELSDLAAQLAAQTGGLLGPPGDARETPPAWAESLAEHIEVLAARVRPVAELPALWADLGMVSENVEQALPRLQAACDMITQTQQTLRAQEDRLAKLQQNGVKLQQSMEAAAGRFSRLDKIIAELSQRAGYLDKEMSAVKSRTDQGFATLTSGFDHGMTAISAALEQGLAGVAAKIDGIGGNVSGLAEQVDLVGGQVQVAHGRLERLDERLGDAHDRIGAVDSKLGTLDAKLTETDGKVGALANRIDRVDDRIGDTDDRIGLIDDHISAVGHKLGALDGRMEGLDGRLEGVGGRIDGMAAKFEAVDGHFAAVSGHFAGVDGRLEAVGDHIEAVGDRMDAVNRQIARLPASLGIEDAHRRLTELTGQSAADLAARLDALDDHLTAAVAPLAGELRSQPGKAEVEAAVSKVVSAAQSDIVTRLNSLEETVLTLAEALLRPASRPAADGREGDRI